MVCVTRIHFLKKVLKVGKQNKTEKGRRGKKRWQMRRREEKKS